MAQKKIFFVNDNNEYETDIIDYTYFKGFALVNKQKSIKSLHDSIKNKYKNKKILEVSTKSIEYIGVEASAFNLKIKLKENKERTVEEIFQAAKVFERGGAQNKYLFTMNSRELKAMSRERQKDDKLVCFQIYNNKFPLEPKTYFYNWLYVNSLYLNKELANKIIKYDIFTDIEFNDNKSINCQAEACSIYVSLYRKNLLIKALESKESFLNVVYGKNYKTIEIKKNQIQLDLKL